jgi:glycosyltransferase involved in cell wall biosynthesis
MVSAMKPLISVCIIARDEEQVIKRAIDSVKDIAIEVIVLDTGSVDQTPVIAREAGAKVFAYEWNDDFSEARNKCMSYATGNYVLNIDADEFLVGNTQDLLKELEEYPNLDTYFGTITYPAPAPMEFPSPRMCTNGMSKWYGRIHEFLNPINVSNPSKVILKSLRIQHLKGPKREVATERNIRILTKAIADIPATGEPSLLSRYFFYMARELKDSAKPKEALEWFAKYVPLSMWPPEKYRALLDMAQCYLDVEPHNLLEAKKVCHMAIIEDPAPMESYTILAHIAYMEKDWIRCYNWGMMALNAGPPSFMLFDSTSFNTFKAHDLVSIACWNLGKYEEGSKHVDYCCSIFPQDDRIKKNKEFFDGKLKEAEVKK